MNPNITESQLNLARIIQNIPELYILKPKNPAESITF